MLEQLFSGLFILAVLYGIYYFIVKPKLAKRNAAKGTGGGGKSEPGDSHEN